MHVVLADIGAQWPDVFGPFVNLHEAQAVQNELDGDPRVFHTELQTAFTEVSEWDDALDGILER